MEYQLLPSENRQLSANNSEINGNFLGKAKSCITIAPAKIHQLYAWYGHRHQQKWYRASQGSFLLLIVEPDSWQRPSFNLPVREFILKENKCIHVPAGHAIGYKALEKDSSLKAFSDLEYEPSCLDEFPFDANLWYYDSFM